MDAPKRTVLFGLHQKLRARMTVFGGFAMPVSYRGIIEEHHAVRACAGVFDLSHMGEFELSGPRAIDLLERALTNSAARLREGQAQYTIMCAEDGGTIDDLIVYRTGADRFMLCVNASNIETDREWLKSLNSMHAEFRDLSGETALVAVQGPRTAVILSSLAEFQIDRVARFRLASGKIAGVTCLAARTGYTGEDGFELFTSADSAPRLFETILDAGASEGAMPIGLGARDTLRLEAGLPLYGHELDRSTSPVEAGLDIFIKPGRNFVGERALVAQQTGTPAKRLVGLFTDDRRSIARQGYRVLRGGIDAGVITSGTLGPSIGRPVAMAYLNRDDSRPSPPLQGEKLEVAIRDRMVSATITRRPFYRRGERSEA